MQAVCMKIFEMSIAASWLILVVILLRIFLVKAPKNFRYILWALVAIRLICPFSVKSDFSLVPDMNGLLSTEIPGVEVPEQNQGQNTIIPGTTPSVPDTDSNILLSFFYYAFQSNSSNGYIGRIMFFRLSLASSTQLAPSESANNSLSAYGLSSVNK